MKCSPFVRQCGIIKKYQCIDPKKSDKIIKKKLYKATIRDYGRFCYAVLCLYFTAR